MSVYTEMDLLLTRLPKVLVNIIGEYAVEVPDWDILGRWRVNRTLELCAGVSISQVKNMSPMNMDPKEGDLRVFRQLKSIFERWFLNLDLGSIPDPRKPRVIEMETDGGWYGTRFCRHCALPDPELKAMNCRYCGTPYPDLRHDPKKMKYESRVVR